MNQERFWMRVNKTEACWLWTGCTLSSGYGQAKYDGKDQYAHRIAWQLMYGPIPEGMFVCHHCDNPPCCRLDHLFLGTQADNMADMCAKSRQASGDRHGSRLYPERRPRGVAHWTNTKPERIARGDRQGARLHPETVRCGESNGNAKLSDAQARVIIALNGTDTVCSLAHRFSVGKTTIYRILHGKRKESSGGIHI